MEICPSTLERLSAALEAAEGWEVLGVHRYAGPGRPARARARARPPTRYVNGVEGVSRVGESSTSGGVSLLLGSFSMGCFAFFAPVFPPEVISVPLPVLLFCSGMKLGFMDASSSLSYTEDLGGGAAAPQSNLWLFAPMFRLVLKVLAQYRADCKVTTVALRALALLLRSGACGHRKEGSLPAGGFPCGRAPTVKQ